MSIFQRIANIFKAKPTNEIKPKDEEKKDISAGKAKPESDKVKTESEKSQSVVEIITPAKTPDLPKKIIGKDGAPMVLIPAGEFEMGSNKGGDDEKPAHTVYLDAFYIDIYEVTNAQYKKFMDATGYKEPYYWNYSELSAPNHPVVVHWDDAVAYARWARKRLPTEAEWEKPARGGLVGKNYPWGDNLTHDDANYEGIGGKDKWEYTSPVGSFAPNGYGLYDMAGNVWEWCADWYDGNYYANSPKQNPKGPSSGSGRVLRGGSWDTGDFYSLRVAYRYDYDPTHYYYGIGFRCVQSKNEIKPKDEEKKDISAEKREPESDKVITESKYSRVEIITPSKTLDLPKEIIGKDGAPMVLIPAGEFEMGSNSTDWEKPIHTVHLDAFYMDKYEVTNAQYKKFMDATRYKAPYYWNDLKFNALNHPVVGVNWNDANEYCKWAGKRLPTEAEWEKAASGGLLGKKYPWGDTLTHDDANYSGTGGKDKWGYTSPVGSFAPNGYGLYDMAGNVLEWCADWYSNNYYANSPKSNPTGPSSGEFRVLRGGDWFGNDYYYLRVASRYGDSPTTAYYGIGFRCAGLPVTP